ncbi:MAG: heme ABC exporter ATP-binding protein CcmA [Kiloniellales bacterium]
MSLFEGRGLTCIRSERLVFAGLDFALPPGGALLLTGPNGSGKSSLLRLMAGLLPPAAGALLWDGRPITEDPEAHRARLHYLSHLDAVKPVLTARENLAFWAALHGGEAGNADAALERLGLAPLAELPGRLLSAGQKRRLALARVAAAPAGLWLLDEPTVALDQDSIARFTALLAEHRKGGGRVVAATHIALDLPDARRIDMAKHQAGETATADVEET